MILNKSMRLLTSMFLVGSVMSCATTDDQMQDQFEDLDQEEEQEQLSSSTDDVLQQNLQSVVNDNSGAALASELDSISNGQDPTAGLGLDPSINNTGFDNSFSSPSVMPQSQPPITGTVASTNGDSAEYIVQPGDTLTKISQALYGNGGRWSELADDNGIINPSRIYPGDVVRYRLSSRSRNFQAIYDGMEQEVIMVERGDTLQSISMKLFGRKDYWKPIWMLNRQEIPNPDRIEIGQVIRYVDPEKMIRTLSQSGINGLAH